MFDRFAAGPLLVVVGCLIAGFGWAAKPSSAQAEDRGIAAVWDLEDAYWRYVKAGETWLIIGGMCGNMADTAT